MLTVKQALKCLHSKHFSQAHLKMEEFRRKLVALQALPDLNTNDEMQQEEKECCEKLRSILVKG